MNDKILGYEDRIKRIQTVDDIDKQIDLARQYAQRLRQAGRKQALGLGEKLHAQTLAKQADAVTRKLRLNRFAIEDQLNQTSAIEETDSVRFFL